MNSILFDRLLRRIEWFGARSFLNSKTYRTSTNPPFTAGEFVLVTESRFKGLPHLIKLTSDCTTQLKSRKGKRIALEHRNVIGREENGNVLHVEDVPFRIRRPSLEEYVVYMKRVATPSYPKDIQTILSVADIGPGSHVAEAGTGSGALTLFLSRAVGNDGHVHSFDNNDKHMKNGKENVSNWCSSWNQTKLSQWPQNVTFHNSSVKTCVTELPKETQLDAVLLDLQSPEYCLEFLLPAVKDEKPIVVFLPSITQIVDVVRYCNLRKLPCQVENIIEVEHRMWKVLPVILEDQSDVIDSDREFAAPIDNNDETQNAVRYTVKPSYQQLHHTGFILKLLHRR